MSLVVFFKKAKPIAAVSCSLDTLRLGGVGFVFWLMGKLGRAWVGAWRGAWVHGMVHGWDKDGGVK